MKKAFLFIVLLGFVMSVAAQISNNRNEGWISMPGIAGQAYGVYYFRKDVKLAAVPTTATVNVSGDNRYKLFVNGKLVCLGPTRSDLAHWCYDVVDLAPYLHTGNNVVVAKVWNEGQWRPEANMSFRTAFMIEAAEPAAKAFATGDSWRCIQDQGYQPLAVHVPGYYVAGPGDVVDFRKAVSGWASEDASLAGWQQAQVVTAVRHRGAHEVYSQAPGWQLRPSSLPQRELTTERLAEVRQAKGIKVPAKFLQGKAPLTIPAHSEAEVLLDQRHLTNAYPTFIFSGGKDATLSIGYAEALYNDDMTKGNRDDVAGKQFVGRWDSIISNGVDRQTFTTMAWRTFRYVLLRVKTVGEALTINDLYGTFTGYPFQLKASLTTIQPSTINHQLSTIFDIGWRSARLCAIESYMDCPYYEQLQYFGDARIQALVTMFMTDDDRLVKNYYDMADWSRGADGVTQSRYPSAGPQWIQPYALHYIYSLHDYMMYGRDMEFIKSKLMSTRTILDYFHHYQQRDGRVKDLPGWNFSDWVYGCENWEAGEAIPGADGSNCVMDLQLLYAYELAADLEATLGMGDYAKLYNERAGQLKQTIQKNYWCEGRGLYADRSDKDCFSQHAQALAILTGMVTGDDALQLAKKLESDTTLAPASIYFKYYTHEAMAKAGLADHYLSWLDKWRENIANGLTTWAETSDINTTRSDCHAWGSSPNVELFRTVLGIDSDAPAFDKVRIEPHLGAIKKISGQMPHPQGTIAVSYQVKGKRLQAEITLPTGVTGQFIWHDKSYPLHGGQQSFSKEY